MKIEIFMMVWFLAVSASFPIPSRAEAASLNVADFGARGDAVQTLAMTVSNSAQISLETTNQYSAADVGKLIELFGVGAFTSGTNNQDLIGFILSVTDGTNITISVPASRTSANVNCTLGTQNAVAFQNCVNACQGTNTTILVPAGSYLLVPPLVLNTNYTLIGYGGEFRAVSISKGGIRFQGESPDTTRLLGNGAWVLMGGATQRGMLFGCVGPVTNNTPLVFENLTFDGGVQVGNQGFGSGPASPVDGSGWDITHGAVIDMGQPPFHANKQFINCHFAHWRGEMLKSVVAWNTGFISVTNCAFWDGDGSGFNFNWTPHVINGCLFSNLNMAMEYYVGSMAAPSTFENSVITNTRIAIGLVGALTNYPSPGYFITSNTISATQYGICLGPARNVTIAGNTFIGNGLSGVGIATDSSAYQGNDINRDILVENNQFVNTLYPLGVCGDGVDRLVNMTWLTNTAFGCKNFASGYGWSSNIVFIGNSSFQPSNAGRLDSTALTGQWFIDDPSDNFPARDLYIGKYNPTNTLSYANGMRYELQGNNPQGVCFLDASLPQSIPPRAELVITNASAYPAPTLYFVNSNQQDSGLALAPGNSITCEWTNNAWELQPPPISPPSGLRTQSP